MLVSGTSRALDSTPSTRIIGPSEPVAAGFKKREGTASGSPSFEGRFSIQRRSNSMASAFCDAKGIVTSTADTLTVSASAATCNNTRIGLSLRSRTLTGSSVVLNPGSVTTRAYSPKASPSNRKRPSSSELIESSWPVVWFRSFTFAPTTICSDESSTTPRSAPVPCPSAKPARTTQQTVTIVNGLNAPNRYWGRLLDHKRTHERQAPYKDQNKDFALKNVLRMQIPQFWRSIRDTIGRISVILPQREWSAGIPWLHTSRPCVRTSKRHPRAGSAETSSEPPCLTPAR